MSKKNIALLLFMNKHALTNTELANKAMVSRDSIATALKGNAVPNVRKYILDACREISGDPYLSYADLGL